MAKTICLECFGEGRIIAQSKALEVKLVQKKCTTCKGNGEVDSIMNSAFLNNNQLIQFND